MGCYINPLEGTKEQFLLKYGKEENSLSWEDKPENCLPVVWIDNGMFTAACVAYCEGELEEVTCPTDHRPKRYFYVALDDLKDVSPILDYMKDERS
jgi:hypothetical protein